MARLYAGWPQRRQAVWAVSIAAVSAIMTVLVLRVMAPRYAGAQAGQAGEVRASAFVLVGPDGTVLARLAPGGRGNGNLTVFDTAGKARAVVEGSGAFVVNDSDGTTQLALLAFNRSDGNNGIRVSDQAGNARMTVGLSDGQYRIRILDAAGRIVAAFPQPAPRALPATGDGSCEDNTDCE